MRIQRSRSLTLILLLFCALPPFSSGLKWFVSPPREESGLTSVNFSKARDQLEQNLSGKVFSEREGGKSANSEGTDRGLGGRREPKQFRLLSNFSDLIQSNSRLAPSDTFCKCFSLILPNLHPCWQFQNLSKPTKNNSIFGEDLRIHVQSHCKKFKLTTQRQKSARFNLFCGGSTHEYVTVV